MKNKLTAILCTLCLGAFLGALAFAQDETQKTLRDLGRRAQTIRDAQEIENLMALHAFQNKGCLKPDDPGFRETVAQKASGVSYGQDGKYVTDDAARQAMHSLDDPTFGKFQDAYADHGPDSRCGRRGNGQGHLVFAGFPDRGGHGSKAEVRLGLSADRR